MIEIFHTAVNYEDGKYEDFITKGSNDGFITIDTFDYFVSSSMASEFSQPWKITTSQDPEDLYDLPRVYYPPHQSDATDIIEFIVRYSDDDSRYKVVLAEDMPLHDNIINYALFELNWIFGEQFVFRGRHNVYNVDLSEEVVLIPAEDREVRSTKFVPLSKAFEDEEEQEEEDDSEEEIEPDPITSDDFDVYDYSEEGDKYILHYGSRDIEVDKEKVNSIEEY